MWIGHGSRVLHDERVRQGVKLSELRRTVEPITVSNNGPDVVDSNFWDSEMARAGKFFFSCNAGTIRMLVPQSQVLAVTEWETAEYVILSRGPWPAAGTPEGIEILFEDHCDPVYAMHLTAASFDKLPGPPEPGDSWSLSAWVWYEGTAYMVLAMDVRWRRVERIPWLKPWE